MVRRCHCGAPGPMGLVDAPLGGLGGPSAEAPVHPGAGPQRRSGAGHTARVRRTRGLAPSSAGTQPAPGAPLRLPPCRCHISRCNAPPVSPPPARRRPIPQAIRLLRNDYAGGSCPPRQGGVGQYPERNWPCQAAAGAIGDHDEPGLTTPVHVTNVVFLWSVGGLTTLPGVALPPLTCSFPCREGGT